MVLSVPQRHRKTGPKFEKIAIWTCFSICYALTGLPGGRPAAIIYKIPIFFSQTVDFTISTFSKLSDYQKSIKI
ncbi:MAG: hypothetical protein IJQ21_10455, partial [Lachnospiraceae bacterium]|nr:hypothetical protein [Lachnospiraceae bacterium]